jgi:hypothetical protein
MKVSFEFDLREINAVKRIVADKLASNRRFVQYRLLHNIQGPLPEIDDDKLWMAHMMCLLTTQQRSGPNSPINLFLECEPFPLSLSNCRTKDSLEDAAFQLLTDAKGIRRTNRIAKAVSENLKLLEYGEWDELRRWRDKLLYQRGEIPDSNHRAHEEDASNYMNRFIEFGPKQSRNFWQSLGLTRYTFVLDSRIVSWLRENLEIKTGLLTAQGLGDVRYYNFISEILLDLCNQANILPCMLDAAIFDSFDEATEWGNETIW